MSVWHAPAEPAAQAALLSVWIRYFCYHRWDRLTVKTATICCFARVARILCKSLYTQTAFGEDEVLIWFDDDCERRRLIYVDEIQPGTSLPKWRRRTFINTLSSVKQPSVGCKEIYKSSPALDSSKILFIINSIQIISCPNSVFSRYDKERHTADGRLTG